MVTRKFAIAKQLGGKKVITDKGETIGRLNDIEVDEMNGDLETFVIELNKESSFAREIAEGRDTVSVPFKAVSAVSDVVVVEESAFQ